MMATWQAMSRDCLQSAKVLLAQGQWRGSINRSYYAAYCAVSHELVARGVRFPRGWNNPAHEQLPALIQNGLTVLRPTRFTLIRALRRLRLARENADYRPLTAADRAVALACVSDASLIIRVMEAR